MIRRLLSLVRRSSPDRARPDHLRPEVRDEVVAFLREWLPPAARSKYREMISNDPAGWHREAHFAEGVAIIHFLRGNGLDERALGVASLEPLWPGLLRDAVESPAGSAPERDAGREADPDRAQNATDESAPR